MSEDTFDVFHRTWWKPNPSWPNGREPGTGTKHYLARGVSEQEAREMCQEWK